MEPHLKTSYAASETKAAWDQARWGPSLEGSTRNLPMRAKMAKSPRTLQQDACFEIFLGNFATECKSSWSSTPAKSSRLCWASVYTPSLDLIRFSLIYDGVHKNHLYLKRAVDWLVGTPCEDVGPWACILLCRPVGSAPDMATATIANNIGLAKKFVRVIL